MNPLISFLDSVGPGPSNFLPDPGLQEREITVDYVVGEKTFPLNSLIVMVENFLITAT